MKASVITKLSAAKQRLCTEHFWLVEAAVRRQLAKFPSMDEAELNSAGNVGLITAAYEYSPARGEFEAFAAAHIRGAMLSAVRNTFKLWTRENVSPRACEIHTEERTEEEYQQRVDEVFRMSDADLRREAVADLRLRATALSVSRLAQAPHDAEEEHLHQREVAMAYLRLHKALKMVSEPQKTFYRLYYDEELTLDEVSTQMRTPKRTVQRIGKRLLAELQQLLLGDAA